MDENKAASPRWNRLVEMYGSEDAAKQEMKRRGALSARNRGGKGGFAKLKSADPSLHKKLSSKGGKVGKKERTPEG